MGFRSNTTYISIRNYISFLSKRRNSSTMSRNCINQLKRLQRHKLVRLGTMQKPASFVSRAVVFVDSKCLHRLSLLWSSKHAPMVELKFLRDFCREWTNCCASKRSWWYDNRDNRWWWRRRRRLIRWQRWNIGIQVANCWGDNQRRGGS